MNKIFTKLLATCFLLLSGYVVAQPCSVTIAGNNAACPGAQTTLTATTIGPDNQIMASNSAGNNHRGNMFDIVATNTVTITSFDASPMGNTTIEIYYKVGTWNGFANTPSAWTFVGSGAVPYTGGFSAVPVNVNVTIPAGQTYAFYVTSNTSAVSLNYSNGTNVGNVYSSDANITFLEGGGMEYPFTGGTGAVYQPRVWNGNIHYSLNGLPTTSLWGAGETTNSIQPTINATTQFTVESTITGCPTLYDTMVVQMSVPTVSAGNDQTICTLDTVTLHATGNAANYVWNNGVTDNSGFSPASSNSYIVTAIDSIGCTNADTVTVNVNALPPVSAGADFAVCIGNDTVLNGQGALTYSWNNGVTDGMPFTPSSSMDYIVTGTDINNCHKNDTVHVTVNPIPAVYAGADVSSCAGSETILSGSGTVTYTWNNGVTNGVPFVSPSGINSYIVTGSDAIGCSNTDTVVVTTLINEALIAQIGNTLITSMTPGYTVQWYNCSTQQVIAGETGWTYTPTVSGYYAAIVTNTDQCTDTSDCILMDDFAGINQNNASAFTVYPNPTAGAVTIQSSSAMIDRIEIIDLVGKVVYEEETNQLKTAIDISRFDGQQFFVKIYNGDSIETVKVQKF